MALEPNGKISLLSFLLGVSILLVPFVGFINTSLQYVVQDFWRYLLGCHAAVANGALLFLYRGHPYQVAVRGCFLGLIFGIGLIISFSGATYSLFGWYMTALAFFHWSEYFTTAVTNPQNLKLDSYLLDHSREYHLAALGSWVEFVIEWYLFPGMKHLHVISTIGLLMVIAGEALRKLAMYTASTNFNHYVRHVKEDGHHLVTHGVYGIARHPAYMGWFYWSIGTQIMLVNPFCTVAYAYVSWKFFENRINSEEISLLNFFGESYLDYQKRVGTGLPFISGYRMEL